MEWELRPGSSTPLVEDLLATLDEFNVPKPEQDELLALIAPMRDEIVEVESPETGTPLPDAYRPAPAPPPPPEIATDCRRGSLRRLTTRNAGNLVHTPATGPHRVRDVSCCGVELAGRRPG
jgi:hypothetical protein